MGLALQRRQSLAGWKSGCARRDRTWERDRRIFDRHREGHAVEIVAAEHGVSRSQAYRIIARIRKAVAEKAELSEGERAHRRKARALAQWSERQHRKRLWRRLQFGIPYDAPYFPSAYRRRYPDRLSAKYRESRQPNRIQNSPTWEPTEPPIVCREEGNRKMSKSPEYERMSFRPVGGNCWEVAYPRDADAVSFVRADIFTDMEEQRDRLEAALEKIAEERRPAGVAAWAMARATLFANKMLRYQEPVIVLDIFSKGEGEKE